MIGTLREQRQARGDTRAGTNDNDRGEETSAAHDTELRSAASVDLLGRAVNDLAGPVAGVRDDDREALVAAVGETLERLAIDGALLVGKFGGGGSERVGDDAKGVGFLEGGIGEADGLAKVDIAVFEVELDAVGREDFGFDVAETHARPGVGDEEGGKEEHPPGGVADQEMTKGMVRRGSVGGVGGLQHDLSPEEADDSPSHEAVRILKGVVHEHTDAGVRKDEHDHEHGDDGVAEEVDVSPDGVEGTFLVGAEVDGEQNEVDDIPEGGSHGTARVKTAIRVDLGGKGTGPERKHLGPGTKDPEHAVDDVLVADDEGHQEVGSDGSGSLLVVQNRAVLDTRADDEPQDRGRITQEGQAEDAAVDGPKVPSQVPIEAVAFLGRQGGGV